MLVRVYVEVYVEARIHFAKEMYWNGSVEERNNWISLEKKFKHE